MKEKGLNYIIVQVQFTNGVTGIYSGAIDVKPTINDKSYYSNSLKDDLKTNKGLKVIASKSPKINQDSVFFQVVQNIVCDDLLILDLSLVNEETVLYYSLGIFY